MNSSTRSSKIPLLQLLRDEFRGYSLSTFQKDLLASLTVAAVALPLALAFGIASGSTAAAGLVTAILAGIVIGGLSGAPFQISGPTGAMSAVLILVANQYGPQALLLVGVMAGVMILLVGLFKLGRTVLLIPRPVITGFTSGIAIIIFVGQLGNFFGVTVEPAQIPFLSALGVSEESSVLRLLGYLQGGFTPNWQTVATGSIVIAMIFLLPKSISRRVPGSLLGLVVATLLVALLGWQEPVIGAIPNTIVLQDRLTLDPAMFQTMPQLFVPALSVAALGAIESLLCGAVGSKATGKRMDGDQELIAQGIGNIVIPFFGGVPATAAIARTSVAINSGGQTRVVSILHGLILLLCVLFLGPVLANVPLAALAGVLMATAIRMNEWGEIKWMFRHRFKSAIVLFFVTMIATALLDLTQAIIIGVGLSALFYLYRSSDISVSRKEVDVKMLQERGHKIDATHPDISVVYITGPLFFAAVQAFRKEFGDHRGNRVLILSMRGVPLIDVSGLELIEEVLESQHKCGGELMLCAVQPNVKTMLDRSRLTEEIGANNIFWAADQAILEANRRLGVT
jgi:SulP family sulfate permease